MSNSLDPDQACHSVGLDLGTNCLQRLSAEDKTMILIILLVKYTVNSEFFAIILFYFLPRFVTGYDIPTSVNDSVISPFQCVYIVKAKYQIVLSKAVVGVDWPLKELSRHIQKPY